MNEQHKPVACLFLMQNNAEDDDILFLPCALISRRHHSDGLPLGFQIAGRLFDDATVLRAARAYERATDWHTRRPPLQ